MSCGGGVMVRGPSCSGACEHSEPSASCALYFPPPTRLKPQRQNTQRMVTSAAEHAAHPSSVLSSVGHYPLPGSPCRQHLQQWTSAHYPVEHETRPGR